MELFGGIGYLHALNGDSIVSRMRENIKAAKKAYPLPAPINDPITYLTAVLKNKIPGTDDQSALFPRQHSVSDYNASPAGKKTQSAPLG